jgi:transcriptional regulator with XRE-family HTH domain
MAKNSLSLKGLPDTLAGELARAGELIRLARKRRDMTQAQLAASMFVTVATVKRLERGEAGVGLGVFLTALFCLRLNYRVSSLFAPDKDEIGIHLETARQSARKLVRKKTANKLDF